MLLALVLWRAQFWDLPQVLSRIDWLTPLAVLSLNVPVLALWVLRSGLVIRKLGYRLPLNSLVLVTTLGNVAGTVTPAGVGDLLRSRALKEKHGWSGSNALAAVLYERIYLPFLLILATAVAAILQAVSSHLWVAPVVIAGGLLAAAYGGWLYPFASAFVRSVAPRSLTDIVARRSWMRSLGDSDRALRSLFADISLNLTFSLITGLVYFLAALQVWLLVEALGGGASVMEAWIAFALGSLASLMVMLPAGLGVFDASFPAILNSSGVDFLSATAVTLLIRGLQTLPLGLLAVLCYLLLSRQRQQQVSSEEPVPATPTK